VLQLNLTQWNILEFDIYLVVDLFMAIYHLDEFISSKFPNSSSFSY